MKYHAIKQQSTYRKLTLSGLMLITLLVMPSLASTKTITSGIEKVVMIELYTSQGCSSCPPAENWISKFKDDPRLWHQIVPINFHVDYWDYLGWIDPFADKQFSKRQRDYKQQKYTQTVATPGFVVDGKGWNGWFYQLKLPQLQSTPVGTLSADIMKLSQQANVTFAPIKKLTEPLTLHVAVLGFELSTDVRHGENKGKQLKHDFVVIGYQHQALSLDNNIATAKLSMPDSSLFNNHRRAAVFWVSRANDSAPIQVAGDWW